MDPSSPTEVSNVDAWNHASAIIPPFSTNSRDISNNNEEDDDDGHKDHEMMESSLHPTPITIQTNQIPSPSPPADSVTSSNIPLPNEDDGLQEQQQQQQQPEEVMDEIETNKQQQQPQPLGNTTIAAPWAESPQEMSRPVHVRAWRWIRRIWSFWFLCRLVLANVALGFAVVEDPYIMWQNVPTQHWLIFTSIVLWSWDFFKMVEFVAEWLLFYARPHWTTVAYYYLRLIRHRTVISLASLAWLISFATIIFPYVPNEAWAYYTIRGLGTFFMLAALLALAAFTKQYVAVYFQRGTYVSEIRKILQQEYSIWTLCPWGLDGAIIASDVVRTLVDVGAEAVMEDPRVIRSMVRYVRHFDCEGYASRTGDIITIEDEDDARDVGSLIWDTVAGELPDPNVDMADVLNDLRGNRVKTRAPVRAMIDATRRATIRPMRPLNKRSDDDEGDMVAPIVDRTVQPSRRLAGKLSSSRRHVNQQSTQSATGIPIPQPPPPPQPPPAEDRTVKRRAFERLYHSRTKLSTASHLPRIDLVLRELDPTNTGYITKSACIAWLMRFYESRQNLALTLHDAQSAVDRFGNVVTSTAITVAFVIGIVVFSGTDSYQAVLTLATVFATIAIVFGSTLATMFENLIFVFSRRPFDVGDLVTVEDMYYSVRRIELLSTLFIQWDGQYVLMDNSWLRTQKVFNLSRSGSYWHTVAVKVDVGCATFAWMEKFRSSIHTLLKQFPESFTGMVQTICADHDPPLSMMIETYAEFSYKPNNLTKLFRDIGRVNEIVGEALRINGASSSGSGMGVVSLGGKQPTFARQMMKFDDGRLGQ